jgi:uncharacterized peroxidase-related enzyme
LLGDDDLLDRIDEDWRKADLSPKRVAMLEYVERLTRHPGDIADEDIESLREAGFADRDILDICEVAAYYAYVNRIADGLGVALETWIPDHSPVV